VVWRLRRWLLLVALGRQVLGLLALAYSVRVHPELALALRLVDWG
jgi:hypothetical protein